LTDVQQNPIRYAIEEGGTVVIFEKCGSEVCKSVTVVERWYRQELQEIRYRQIGDSPHTHTKDIEGIEVAISR
jgi:predicted metalloprotease